MKLQTKFPPNFLVENNIVLDNREEWRVFKRKNTWRKLYRSQTYKIGVIDSFCASFSNCLDSICVYDGDNKALRIAQSIAYRQFIVDADRLAQGFAISSAELIDGWKIHKDWFRCMVVQLLTHNAGVYGLANAGDQLRGLFAAIGFGDYMQYLNPKYDDITSVHKIPYNFITPENGTITRHYTVLIEPTSPIPCGSEWVAKSGVVWKAGLPFENGLIDFMAVRHEDGSAVSEIVRHFHPNQVHGMRRIK